MLTVSTVMLGWGVWYPDSMIWVYGSGWKDGSELAGCFTLVVSEVGGLGGALGGG